MLQIQSQIVLDYLYSLNHRSLPTFVSDLMIISWNLLGYINSQASFQQLNECCKKACETLLEIFPTLL